ncbi:minor capsid protein [Mycobacteroides abscessus]|uniref:minor capsid protein n=1 Tax=Mycobacteroides abscessus TaxID=36809 RepID=UPI0012FFF024
MIREIAKETLHAFDQQIKPEIKSYQREDGKFYNLDGPLDIIRRVFEWLKSVGQRIFSRNRIEDVVRTFVVNINTFNRLNMAAQAGVRGIELVKHEKWLDDFMKLSIHENVNYISTIRDEYFTKIETIVYQGVKNGQSIKEIREQLVKQIGMTEKRAQFIAVDQSGSILGQMTAKRHKSMGVNKFKWSTSGDERVRPSHRALSDNIYSYDDPPSEGFPGTPFRCRCVAIPVFDDGEEA